MYHTTVFEPLGTEGLVEIPGPGWMAAFANAAEAADHLDPAALAGRAAAWAVRAVGRDVAVLYADQRHTAILYSYSAAGPLAARAHCVGICDGLLSGERGVALMVRTADCLPVIIAGPDVVASVHCGWRSLAGDILGKCLRRFSTEFGIPASAVQVVIGVGIGPCHYTVGAEVKTALSALPVAVHAWHHGGSVNLAAWARGRLINQGVPGDAIRTLPGCTACSPRHHSFRRDGHRAGRQWAAVMLT